MEKAKFQMIHHIVTSKGGIGLVKAAWFVQKASPKYLSAGAIFPPNHGIDGSSE